MHHLSCSRFSSLHTAPQHESYMHRILVAHYIATSIHEHSSFTNGPAESGHGRQHWVLCPAHLYSISPGPTTLPATGDNTSTRGQRVWSCQRSSEAEWQERCLDGIPLDTGQKICHSETTCNWYSRSIMNFGPSAPSIRRQGRYKEGEDHIVHRTGFGPDTALAQGVSDRDCKPHSLQPRTQHAARVPYRYRRQVAL